LYRLKSEQMNTQKGSVPMGNMQSPIDTEPFFLLFLLYFV